MTASKQAKEAGIKSLRVVAEWCGHKSDRTLTNWYKNKPELFRVVVAGVAALEKEKEKSLNKATAASD